MSEMFCTRGPLFIYVFNFILLYYLINFIYVYVCICVYMGICVYACIYWISGLFIAACECIWAFML